MFLDSNMTLTTFFYIVTVTSTIDMILTIIAWIGNSLIIVVTIRSKNLRSACNILVAMQAVSDIVMQMSHPVFVYYAYSQVLVSFYTCYYINFVFISALDFSTFLMFFIALDRFISAKYPLFYGSLRKPHYISAIVLISLTYATIFKVLLYTSLTEELTFCMIAESMTGAMTNVWFGVSTIVNLGVVGLYFPLTRTIKSSVSEYHHINRSLNTQILVFIFGWFCTMSGCSFALLASPNHRVYTAIETIVGIPCNVNLAAPFFVYYFRSTLYRDEFNRLFGYKSRSVYSASHAIPSRAGATNPTSRQTSEP